MGQDVQEVRPGVYALSGKPSSLNAVEALALHAAARLLYHSAPSGDPFLRSALGKLAALLPEPARALAHRSAEDLSERKGDGRTLEHVARAWFEGRVLEVEYRAAGTLKWKRRELEVFFVEASRANLELYALARDRLKGGAVLAWKLGRMRDARLTEEHYAIPQEFDPRAYLRQAFGIAGAGSGETVRVALRFTPEAAERVREGLPNLERVEDLSDGGVRAEFVVGTDEEGFPFEFLPWVLSWGSRVEVLEPQNFRKRWLDEIKGMLRAVSE